MMYQLAENSVDDCMDAATFKRVVLAFNDHQLAAEILTGLTVDEYDDLAVEDEEHPLVHTFYHALNPDLITG